MPLSREHILEAALLTAKKPVSVRELRRLFDDELSHADVLKLLESLSAFWQERGLRLREVAGGWRMETAPEATPFLFKLKDEDRPKRFTRAALETLAVIAYRQPVTRGDIEEIRGVSLSPGTLRMFEERGAKPRAGPRSWEPPVNFWRTSGSKASRTSPCPKAPKTRRSIFRAPAQRSKERPNRFSLRKASHWLWKPKEANREEPSVPPAVVGPEKTHALSPSGRTQPPAPRSAPQP